MLALLVCGTALAGDHVSYSAWNRASMHAVEDIRVMAADVVSWRMPPREGQEHQKGDLQGPYELDVEAPVPADVRKLVRSSRKSQLEFAVAIGELPLSVRWRLVEWSPDYAHQKEVRRGGEW